MCGGGKSHKDARMFFCEGGQTITFWEEAAAAAIDKWGCFSAQNKTNQIKSYQIKSNQRAPSIVAADEKAREK